MLTDLGDARGARAIYQKAVKYLVDCEQRFHEILRSQAETELQVRLFDVVLLLSLPSLRYVTVVMWCACVVLWVHFCQSLPILSFARQ